MVFVIFFGLLAAAIYFFLGDYLLQAHLWLRGFYLKALGWIGWHPAGANAVAQMLAGYETSEWTMQRLSAVSRVLHLPMFLGYGSVFAALAWRVYAKADRCRSLKHKYTAATLADAQAQLYPWTMPARRQDLVSMPIDAKSRAHGTPDWTMSYKPLDFARKYRLLSGKTINQDLARRRYAMQLGRLWEGSSKLPRHIRALYGAFIAQACRDRDGAHAALAAIAATSANPQPDYAPALALLEKYRNHERVRKIEAGHAYVVTVLLAALDAAHDSGVLPPNFFLWLRPLDRGMWYALDSVGRRTPFAEVAGVFAHYHAEIMAGHALERPYVDSAVAALERSLGEIIFD